MSDSEYGVGLLRGSRSWAEADQSGMRDWFAAYLNWLRTSKGGKEEAAAANNHGCWYDAQLASFLLFLGDNAGASQIIDSVKDRRIARHWRRACRALPCAG